MARRGKPTDLLGSFFKSAMQQLGTVREVVVQKSKAGRIQIDLTLLKRKRKDALAELGEAVARLAANGVIDEEDYPQLSGPLSRLEAVDEQIESAERRARNASLGVDDRYAQHAEDRDDDADDADADRDAEEYDDPDANLDPPPVDDELPEDDDEMPPVDDELPDDHAEAEADEEDDPDVELTRPGSPRSRTKDVK